MSERIDAAAARLLGISRASGTEKGLAKDIRTVLDALTVAQGKAVLSHQTTMAEQFDYTDIANRVQFQTGRSIWPRTVEAVLKVALSQPTPTAEPCAVIAEHAPHEWDVNEGAVGFGSRCPGVAAPPTTADMVPGTTFEWEGHRFMRLSATSPRRPQHRATEQARAGPQQRNEPRPHKPCTAGEEDERRTDNLEQGARGGSERRPDHREGPV